VLKRTVSYIYYETGHVSNPFGRLRASIIVKDEGVGDEYEWYCDVCFTYWGLGHSLVALALWDQWKEDAGGEGVPGTYTKLALREFRYHPNPRGRLRSRAG